MVHAPTTIQQPVLSPKLRPYQEECLRQLADSYRRGNRRVMVCCPTGGGKSLIGATVVKGALAKGRRVLWIAHRSELIYQAAKTIRQNTGSRIGIVQGQTRADPGAPVQIATIQTLVRRDATPKADLVICDEAHRMRATLWEALLDRYQNAHFLHLTATPERGDGKPLSGIADDLVGCIQPADLIRDGFLVPCEVIAPKFDVESGIAQDPVDAYLKWGGGRRGVTFCQSQEHARVVCENFNASGVRAASVLAESTWEYRSAVYSKLQRGELTMLVNVFVATEGLDIPELEVCILARTMGHAAMFIQAAGRVMRPATGKSKATVIDLKGVVDRFGTPESDRIYSLDGEEAVKLDDKGARGRMRCASCGSLGTGTSCPVCGQPTSLRPSVPEVESVELERRPSRIAGEDPSQTADPFCDENRLAYVTIAIDLLHDVARGKIPSTSYLAMVNLSYKRSKGVNHHTSWEELVIEHVRGKMYPYPAWWPARGLPREALSLGRLGTKVQVTQDMAYGLEPLLMPVESLKFLTV